MKLVHPFQRRVLQYIQHEQLLAGRDSILVAVSGGPDSAALLHVLVALRERCGISRLTVLHFDHQLRGAASREDQAFVESLATAFGLPFHTASADVRAYHHQHHISLEMAARICRHRFFREALDRLGANAVALGHTANDQAEEVLLRLFRGTGPTGMAGMLPKTGDNLVRPLLGVTRQAVLAYLRDQQLGFREDPSNLDPIHQRNALRHGIFPLLEKHFHPRVVAALCRHAELVKEEETLWRELSAQEWEAVCVSQTPSWIALDGPRLLALHPALRKRVLRLALGRMQGDLQGVYYRHLEALCRLLTHGTPGRFIHLPRGLWATFEGNSLTLSRQPQEAPFAATGVSKPIMNGPGRYHFPSLTLSLTIQAPPDIPDLHAAPDPGHTVRVDADRVQWPLCLRFWEKGDRFCPLGLGGTKKLQDFFGDLKIPRRERHRIPLLCDREKICWVVGYRLDDRVKITPQTRRLLVIERSGIK